jgi:hypothetical protein
MVGPLRLQLERAVAEGMLADFLSPPTDEVGEFGMLAIYLGHEVSHVAVSEANGRIPVGSAGVSVEIAEYLPNAVPDRLGRFTSQGNLPRNPMLELRVHVPGSDEPLRQIALAKQPLLNLDAVYGRECPVKFRYYHPAVKPTPAFEMFQTPDGRLFGRMSGLPAIQQALKPGDRFPLPSGLELSLAEYFPHARRRIRFEPLEPVPGARQRDPAGEPAARFEILAGGVTQEVWLRRNDPVYGRRLLATASGTLSLSFESSRAPLGFELTLIDFQRRRNPGNIGNASFTSRVRVVDPVRGLTAEHEIAMNQPLTAGRLTLYQSGIDDQQGENPASRFRVAHDPGRAMKYLGGLMVCLGIAIMFYMRAYFFEQVGEIMGAGGKIMGRRQNHEGQNHGNGRQNHQGQNHGEEAKS